MRARSPDAECLRLRGQPFFNALPVRMPGTPTRGESGCQAPPPHAGRFPTRFPRGATIDIVCLKRFADSKGQSPDNVKNGTSTARGPTYTKGGHVHRRGRAGGNSEIRNFERRAGMWQFKIQNSTLIRGVDGREFKIQN